MVLRWVLVTNHSEAVSRAAETHQFQERGKAADEATKALRIVGAIFEELPAERGFQTTGTKQGKADCGILANHIRELVSMHRLAAGS